MRMPPPPGAGHRHGNDCVWNGRGDRHTSEEAELQIRGHADRCEHNGHNVRAHCQVRNNRPPRLIDEIPPAAVVLHNQPLDVVPPCWVAISHTAMHHAGANSGSQKFVGHE